jgi:manganese transport system substrate-binding protein
LANDYGLTEAYLWAVNEESDGSPQRIARLVDLIRERSVPAVFCESTVGQQVQMEVVRATNAQFGGLLYVDSLSDASGPTPTHLRLLEHTVETISSGLTAE